MGGSPKWMLYKGKSHYSGWFGGTPISGNLHFGRWRENIPLEDDSWFSGDAHLRLNLNWNPEIVSSRGLRGLFNSLASDELEAFLKAGSSAGRVLFLPSTPFQCLDDWGLKHCQWMFVKKGRRKANALMGKTLWVFLQIGHPSTIGVLAEKRNSCGVWGPHGFPRSQGVLKALQNVRLRGSAPDQAAQALSEDPMDVGSKTVCSGKSHSIGWFRGTSILHTSGLGDTQEVLRDVLQRFPWLTLELEVLPELSATRPNGNQPRPVEVRPISLLRLMRPRSLRSSKSGKSGKFEEAVDVEEQQLEILICKQKLS